MRIGVVGLGRIGSLHASTLAGLDRVDELVLADAQAGLAEATAGRLTAGELTGGQLTAAQPTGAAPHCAVRAVATAEDVFGAGVDGVVIASSTPTHLPLLDAAVHAGVPAFCEKPVAADPAAATYLLELAGDRGVAVQVGFPRRFDPAFRRAKADADAGVLGRLTTVRSTTLDPAPPPPAYIAGSGGIFRDCAIHDLDTVRWVTGREVVEAYATGSAAGADFFRDAGDVDTASILLTLDDGTLGVISNTRYNGRGYDVRLELHGSADSVAAGLDESLPLRSADPEVAFPSAAPHRFFMDRFATAFRAELAAFTDVVAGAPSPCSLADGLEASWLAEACTLSWQEHRPVTVAEVKAAIAVA